MDVLFIKTGHISFLIYTEAGWMLSPVFDINANETGTGLKLHIDESDNALDVDLSNDDRVAFESPTHRKTEKAI